MTDRERLDLLRSVLLSRRGSATPTSSCLDDETIAGLADGTLSDPEAKASAVRHLAQCESCRRAVASINGALADEAVKRAVPGLERRMRVRRLLWIMGPLTAAAAIVLFIWRSGTEDRGFPVLRDSTIAGSPAPVIIAPRGRVARVDRFVWSFVPGVGRYRIRLYTDDGTVLWTKETADTVLAAPRAPEFAPRTLYLWMVEAQTDWQRWTSSGLVEFRVEGEEGAHR